MVGRKRRIPLTPIKARLTSSHELLSGMLACFLGLKMDPENVERYERNLRMMMAELRSRVRPNKRQGQRGKGTGQQRPLYKKG